MISVIGAGPAGLACAALLRQSGEQVVVLERDEVGAAWETRYDRLHLHTVRWLSSLPGYPIPRSFGKWPSRDRVIEDPSTPTRSETDSPCEPVSRWSG